MGADRKLECPVNFSTQLAHLGLAPATSPPVHLDRPRCSALRNHDASGGGSYLRKRIDLVRMAWICGARVRVEASKHLQLCVFRFQRLIFDGGF